MTNPRSGQPWTAPPSWAPPATPSVTPRHVWSSASVRGRGARRVVARLAGLGFPSHRFATVVDPSVRVPYCCDIGPGSILLGNVTLTAGITVGSHVVMMPGVTLTHDDVVEDFATLAAGVSLGGGVRIGRAAYLGMNSCVRERTRVGAGRGSAWVPPSCVDVPDGETWAGVPARVLEPVSGRSGWRAMTRASDCRHFRPFR